MTLEAGDTIALVCTGSHCDSLEEIEQCQEYLSQRGFKVLYASSTYTRQSAAQRAQDLLTVLLDPTVKMIWSIRGGEGSADLLPYISPYLQRLKLQSPKLLMGFSDFTPILVYFADKLSWPCAHGPGLRQLALNLVSSETARRTWQFLMTNPTYLAIDLRLTALTSLIPDQLNGEVIGGNLSLLSLSRGDCWQFSAKNKILLLEEVNEEAYKVRRALNYLARVGLFDGVRAVIFAGFTLLKPHFAATEFEAIFNVLKTFSKETLQALSVPAYYTPNISHGLDNFPLPFCQLSLGQPTLAQPDIGMKESAQK